MKIDSYQVNASAQRSYQKVEYQSLNATVWGNGQTQSLSAETTNIGVEVSLSEAAQQQLEQAQDQKGRLASSLQRGVAGPGTVSGNLSSLPSNPQELKVRMLESFLFALTGRHTELRLHNLWQGNRASSPVQLALFNRPNTGAIAGFGGEVSATHFKHESEKVAYQAQGVIQTADGKTISVDVSMMMSREFTEFAQTNLSFGAAQPNLCDPLVINYGGTAASLTGEKYAFDLDADGVLDEISFAGAGSGFLALDKNGDGTINDGSDLFGPGTGNGFGELRTYDKDGNNWIDENDAIFSKLRIWSKDANGNDQLFTLKQLGIGAIYLGDVATEFTMTDAANNAQGVMRSTSFFLREDGGAGTISHIDLVV